MQYCNAVLLKYIITKLKKVLLRLSGHEIFLKILCCNIFYYEIQ